MAPKPPAYTQAPNELFDKWTSILGQAELRVYLIIIRKTFGWHKTKDRISLSQLETLTGLHRSNITKAIKSLLERGIIKKEIIGEVGRQETTYQIVMDEEITTEQEDDFKEISNGSCKKTGGGLVKRPTKETIQNKESAALAPSTQEPPTPEPQVSQAREEALKQLALDSNALKNARSSEHTDETVINAVARVLELEKPYNPNAMLNRAIEQKWKPRETSTIKPQKKELEADIISRLEALGAKRKDIAAAAFLLKRNTEDLRNQLDGIKYEVNEGWVLQMPIIEMLEMLCKNTQK